MTITLTREEAQQVLDALINAKGYIFYNVLDDKGNRYDAAADILRARLSAPEPEPVAWRFYYKNMWSYVDNISDLSRHKFEPLYTAPPQREWQGLTDEEYAEIMDKTYGHKMIDAVVEKLREKNT